MEAIGTAASRAPSSIFAWPDEKTESNRFAIAIPHGSSLILTHEWNGLFPGLKDVPPQDRPPVKMVFFAFRIMLGVGFYHDRGGAVRRVAVVAREAVRDALVPAIVAQTLVARFRRRHRRLDRDRERPPALDRPRAPAHRGRGFAGAGRERRDVARPVRARLRRRVLVRHLFHQPADRAAASRDERRTGANAAAAARRRPRRHSRAATCAMGETPWRIDLPLIWAGLIGIAVALYVILDGFDLGIGISVSVRQDDAERDQMMRSIAPFWDGNETWLVLGGGGLLVAFPRAYAIIMPAFYLPVIVMLLALVFRGVTFEFRSHRAAKPFWNVAFAGGSTRRRASARASCSAGSFKASRSRTAPLPAARSIGRRRSASLRAGAGRRLRAARRHLADDEDRRRRGGAAAAKAKVLLVAVLVFMAAVSLWTPLTHRRASRSAGSRCRISDLLWPVPIVTALIALGAMALARARLRARRRSSPRSRCSCSAISAW